MIDLGRPGGSVQKVYGVTRVTVWNHLRSEAEDLVADESETGIR